MPQIFIEDPGNLKHPKNVKTNNNSFISYLVTCRLISKAAIVKGQEKEVFWKRCFFGILKCNKKSNCIKSELLQTNYKLINAWNTRNLIKTLYFRK